MSIYRKRKDVSKLRLPKCPLLIQKASDECLNLTQKDPRYEIRTVKLLNK